MLEIIRFVARDWDQSNVHPCRPHLHAHMQQHNRHRLTTHVNVTGRVLNMQTQQAPYKR